MIRTPVVAGMFYEAEEKKLRNQIKECFMDEEFGPGTVDFYRDEGRKIIGVICPHAGYAFSGMGAAHCYKEIAESSRAETYVIIGTSHTGFPKAAITLQDFETPLGLVKNDQEFSKMLIEKGVVKEDDYPHIREHSIEVQLPFLQFVDSDAKIVPIVTGQDTDYERFAKHLVEVIDGSGKNVVIIASSDFTHYGINYSFIPFEEDVKKKLKDMDMKAIENIKNLDAWGFMDYIKEIGATICGASAIACLVETCKILEANKIEVIKYYTSGDISGDYSNCVGYGSILIE